MRIAGWRKVWLAGGLLCMTAQAGTPRAQDRRPDESVAIAVTILPRLRADLPAGGAALDPGLLCTARLVGWRCPAPLRQAAAAEGFSLSGKAFTLICFGGATDCRLLNVRSMVILESISVSADAPRAQVAATIWEMGAEGAARSRRVRISLRRNAGAEWAIAEYAR